MGETKDVKHLGYANTSIVFCFYIYWITHPRLDVKREGSGTSHPFCFQKKQKTTTKTKHKLRKLLLSYAAAAMVVVVIVDSGVGEGDSYSHQ